MNTYCRPVSLRLSRVLRLLQTTAKLALAVRGKTNKVASRDGSLNRSVLSRLCCFASTVPHVEVSNLLALSSLRFHFGRLFRAGHCCILL
eukprot:2919714-Pleurochrysis_carterae.AAC.1